MPDTSMDIEQIRISSTDIKEKVDHDLSRHDPADGHLSKYPSLDFSAPSSAFHLRRRSYRLEHRFLSV